MSNHSGYLDRMRDDGMNYSQAIYRLISYNSNMLTGPVWMSQAM